MTNPALKNILESIVDKTLFRYNDFRLRLGNLQNVFIERRSEDGDFAFLKNITRNTILREGVVNSVRIDIGEYDTAEIQDAYTLARIFRDFKDGPSPKNVIFYGGALHARNMARILQETFNIAPSYTYDDVKNFSQCVKLVFHPETFFR